MKVCKKDKKNQKRKNEKNEKIEKTDKTEKTYMSLKAFRCFRRLFAGVTVFVASASSPLSVQILNLAEAKAPKKVNNKKQTGSKSSAPKKAHTKKETSKSYKTAKKTSKKATSKPAKKTVKKAVKKPTKKTVKTVKTVKKPSKKTAKKPVKKTKTTGKSIRKTAKTVKTAKPVKTAKIKTDGKTFMYADARTAKIKITVHAPENGKLYAFNPEQYHKSDKTRGESRSVSKGTFVASYNSRGKTKVFERNRYTSDGKDYAYQKYYLVQGSKIIKGPVYVNKMVHYHANVNFPQDSIKGIFNEGNTNVKEAKSLGASSVTMNISTSSLMYPQTYDNGAAASHPADAVPYPFAGKTWYFNKSAVDDIDRKVSAATKAKMNTIIILNAWSTGNDRSMLPNYARYTRSSSPEIFGINTSNAKGREYYTAMMDFLGYRYSQKAHRVGTWVVSNEIDFTNYFYNTKNLNRYMEEYSRQLRITNLAVKKWAGDAKVVVPFTHFWKKIGINPGYRSPSSFTPCSMIELLSKKTKSEGDFNWGIAPHLYGGMSALSDYSMEDSKLKGITGSYKTSGMITFSNLEVLGDFLKRPDMQYKGQRRSVYMTEGGVSSYKNTALDYNRQCAALVQAYYKCSNLSFVKAFNYYRLQDHPGEEATYLTVGLKKSNGKKKPAYNLYKYIDTKSGADYAKKYVKYIRFYYDGKSKGRKLIKNPKKWTEALQVYKTSVNWKKSFDPAKTVKKSQWRKMSAKQKKVFSSAIK